MVARIGQPATVNQIATLTVPSAAIATSLTMPSSVIGRWISGSCTWASAARTAASIWTVTATVQMAGLNP